MPEPSIWLELVTLGALVWLGYIGARLASRFNLPSVTGFLVVGIVLGPHVLGLLSLELMHKIDFVNTLALGPHRLLDRRAAHQAHALASPLVVLAHRSPVGHAPHGLRAVRDRLVDAQARPRSLGYWLPSPCRVLPPRS